MDKLIVFIIFLVIVCNILAKDLSNNLDVNVPKLRHRYSRKFTPFIDYNNYLFDLQYCRRPAKCEGLNCTVCLGAKLPYHSTTLELTDLKHQEDVQEKLELFQYLRYIPKCWAVIQPFLCAVYMPKCIDGHVDLPSREMCKITLEPCKIFYNNSAFLFADFLNCDDERLFPTKCKNDILEVKFNTTGYCMSPLVKTEETASFYPDVEGCGLQCKNSLYNEEHSQIHKLIATCVVICLLLNSFTILTFIIDWKTLSKYPAKAIFYVNLCFFISYFGWFVQFLGNETRHDIVCKKDGTLRRGEPSANENISCVVIFVIVYYFLIAGMVWFVVFSYAWNMSSLHALGKSQERVNKKRAYFHLVAWSLPLVLTITTMALGEIDGDYVTGICFVGFVNMAARAGLLLAPVLAAIIVSDYIIIKGVILLIQVRNESKEIISGHSSRKIRSNIVRMGLVALFMFLFCVITIVYHVYTYMNSKIWAKGLQKYILCKLTSFSDDLSDCKYEARPSVAMLQLQLLAVFGAGIPMASWVLRSATLDAWQRYLKMKFHCGEYKLKKLPKHKIIAEAFSKRKKYKQGDRISIDCNMHPDPLGLNFDLNSADTNNFSSKWENNLPRLLTRRDALPNESAYSVSSNNQFDSEVSLNFRRVSIESRRSSGESQLSVQIAELKAVRKVNTRRHQNRTRTRKRNSRDISLNRKTESKCENRRSSADSQLSVQIAEVKSTRQVKTRRHQNKMKNRRRSSRDTVLSTRQTDSKYHSKSSLDSQLQILNNLANSCNAKKGPNLDRRNANAGLDGVDIQYINNILSNKQPLVIPYNASDDENISLTTMSCNYNASDNENRSLEMSCS